MSTPALYDLVSSKFRGPVVSQVSSSLGEDLYPTKAALGGAVPALLSGMVRRTATHRGITEILGLLRAHRFDAANQTDPIAAIIDAEDVYHLVQTGRPLLAFILESRVPAVTQWLSARAAVRIASASCVLGLATPVILGTIGKEVRAGGWSDRTLRELMSAQRSLLPDPPSGLEEALGPETADKAVSSVRLRAPWWRRALLFRR